MPKIKLTSEGQMTTRSQYSKCDATVSIELNGNEVPSTALIGKLLDEAVDKIQAGITESYQVVPARV